ncbi:OLC1v1013509C1 [Oldenlandia corymbosa var. corymbosa]|uniref:OLC1v1013509C1 n=1 Tax=Oldenlandia corymbosa var. corymbosa TaxID=529605 RepID=A0AAV1E229_OLDCO|nr:OLC1v1013509C1 [Oldenlandia corymbosa var. corymbosa]
MKLQRWILTVLLNLVFINATFICITESSTPPPPFSCDSSNSNTKSFKFCQTNLSISQRARDLVSRLTLDEKISQLITTAPAIPRLGIPAYQWWSEALHGVAYTGDGITFEVGVIDSVTTFPQVLLTTSSFDRRLWYRIGQVIGTEARAVYNGGQAQGMTFWAPNINIFRDPRWGRGQETPGEDPLVVGRYSVAYVRGVQGDSFHGGKLKHGQLKASACCKHFTAYDLDNWEGNDRYGFNARVTKQDLADTYQPPFRSCVHEGRASGIMCAYNRVNGVPNCADRELLTGTARQQWGFHGYITSDCADGVRIIKENHKYARTPEEAVADVLKAGMDVNCGTYLANYTKSTLSQKMIKESDIDRALHNLFSVRMRLGLFNGNPKKLVYGNIGPKQVCTKEHQDLALDAARNGIVLLKNSARLLPLSKKTSSLAVIGPHGNNSHMMLGNYHGPPCITVEVLKALETYVKNTVFHQGCNAVNCTNVAINDAVNTAKGADYVVLAVGLDKGEEREDFDREILTLPGQQERLITAVADAARNPVILVLFCGSPIDVSFAKHNPKIGSILWAGYPGQAGGIALAEIIFGDHNPGGRLPITWYPKDFIKIPMTNMGMRPNPSSGYPGRTYRFYNGEKVFPFGYGLSYSTYAYNFVHVSQSSIYLTNLTDTPSTQSSDGVRYLSVSDISKNSCDNVKFSVVVGVKNSKEMAGRHPVLLYIRQEKLSYGSPIKQLIGFESISLEAGGKAEVEFRLNPCDHLSTANEDGLMVIEEGSRFMVVGDKEYPINVVI